MKEVGFYANYILLGCSSATVLEGHDMCSKIIHRARPTRLVRHLGSQSNKKLILPD